jgi:aminopeptidase-like protein
MQVGSDMYKFIQDIWGYNRSLTGEGVRQTLDCIRRQIPELSIREVPSGTQVFDWKVPQEWLVREAYIVTPDGRKICDFSTNNLHLVGYSVAYRGSLSLSELKEHLYTLPEQPSAIPYITSYYKAHWGFCISFEEYCSLKDGIYSVVIDAEHFDGFLNYGEVLLPGKITDEIFLSTYICHPAMANNELSGVALTTFLSKWIKSLKDREYSYRIVFIPETIGSITYLANNICEMQARIKAGFNISCVGDERCFSYLPSRDGDTLSDRVARHVLKWSVNDFITYTWSDRGSDERQYCAPGVDLPIASIHRSKYGEYPEYHTSLDRLGDVVTANGLEGTFQVYKKVINAIEKNKTYQSVTLCEPQLGSRGLYPTVSTKESKKQVSAMMDILTYSDGTKTLLDIANTINCPIWDLYSNVDILLQCGLLKLYNENEAK